MTKLSTAWRTLTRDQRRAWNLWAKSNKVLCEGALRFVSGHKAFTVVLNNRSIAGEAAAPTVLPTAISWLDGALNLAEAGPFTVGVGYVGFRASQNISAGTKWFVWATPPVDGDETNPHRLLRFVTFLSLGAVANDAVITGFDTVYRTVNGSFNGPGVDGAWPTDKFIWFRLHQYSNGQLSPGVMMNGLIQTEL